MDIKYKRQLSGCIESGKLKDYELKAFTDIFNRDEARPLNLSLKQKNWIDKVSARVLDGIEYPKVEIATEYNNCMLDYDPNAGYTMMVMDEQLGEFVKVGKPFTKNEAVVVLAWLHENLSTLNIIAKGGVPELPDAEDQPF